VVLKTVLLKIEVFWYITPSWLVKSYWSFRLACCPHQKGKGVSVQVMKGYGELEDSSTRSVLYYQRDLGGRLCVLAFLNLGQTHSIYWKFGWVHLKTSRDISRKKKSLLLLLWIAPQFLNNPADGLITTSYAYIITVKCNPMKALLI